MAADASTYDYDVVENTGDTRMIGVCIKYFHENYGGMLQAYATVSILESRGLDYELIRYQKKQTPIGVLKSLPRLLNGVLLNDKYEEFLKRRGLRHHKEFAQNETIRRQAFEQFVCRHFTKVSPVFVGYKALRKGAERYSAVVTGSDQLWSPAGLPTNYYNLMFVPNHIRKISYASSFGVKQIPWYQKKRTAQFLNRIDFISMRENRGQQIVKELTGKSVPTILDPVFMFDQKGWKQLIPVNQEEQGDYIFAYFLGKNSSHRKAVVQAAQKLSCKIITLRHLDQYVEEDENFGDLAPYDVAPDKFLNLLRGAKYICTDSFHGACFSIIHKKSFVIFDRYSDQCKNSKNSRIDTLCENLGLQNRRFRAGDELAYRLTVPIDYKAVERRLETLQCEANHYLDKAFAEIE